MKKVFIILVSLFVMMAASTGLKAQEVTILLRPGWNWIGYPYAESIDLENAFVDFEPMNDDVIQSFWGYSEYATGFGWFGGIDELQPGWGYMYYSNRTEAVIVELSAPASQTTVTTSEPTNITAESAVVGGTVTVPEGSHVFLRGVCWGTEPNPDIDGSHTTEETGIGSFSSTLDGLNPNTTYYVRAYAVSDYGLAYGNEVSFTTEAFHTYVDLGLPSGTLWATCNVGADSPEDYGDYFAWGETQPKSDYSWSTYQYCMGSYNTLTKYCNTSSWGYNGFTDDLTTLLPEDDAATANWGSDWRMPTQAEWQELLDNTTVTWTQQNGVNGRLFTASNGNSLFLPAAGWRRSNSPDYTVGRYWSSSLFLVHVLDGCSLDFNSGGANVSSNDRSVGFSVRPVRSSVQNTAPTGAIDGKFTINADGDQVYFSQGNLQYQASTNTWKFAENQYDYVGSDNSNISSTYDGWIDLFGWGTSGYHDESDPYNVNYQPWSTSTSQVNSSYNYFGYGPSTNMTDPDLTGTSANYDWGVYNPISNGSNTTNQWRTLGHSEWVYLFIHRTTISGIRYAKANVSGVNGVILLPDDWSTDTYSLNNPNDSGGSFGDNVLTDSQWVTLESAGAVFLPAAGYRQETYFGYDVGSGGYENSGGYYWSASEGDRDSAGSMCFYDWSVNLSVKLRFYGFSVRLVRAAE